MTWVGALAVRVRGLEMPAKAENQAELSRGVTTRCIAYVQQSQLQVVDPGPVQHTVAGNKGKQSLLVVPTRASLGPSGLGFTLVPSRGVVLGLDPIEGQSPAVFPCYAE